MLGGVKEANCFIAFEITLMQRAIMIQDSYLRISCYGYDIIVVYKSLAGTSDSCSNNHTTLIA